MLHGDLGFSWRIREPVLQLILTKLPVTLQLAAMAFVIALCIGVPAGVLSAVYRNTVWDYLVNLVGLAGLSTPNFWLGIMLILLVSVQLGWLPPSGYVPLHGGLAAVAGDHDHAGLRARQRDRRDPDAPYPQRHADRARPGLRAHRAGQGLARRRVVVVRHAFRNALVPVVTLGALELGTLLSGAVLTEQVFSIPGFGKLVVDAVFNRDYPVVQGVVLVTACLFILLNLLADVLYVLINPRLRAA